MTTRKIVLTTDKVSSAIGTTPSTVLVPSEQAVADYVASSTSSVIAGTGLVKASDGKTLNHVNSVTAVTTPTVGAITYDAQGHILTITQKAFVDVSTLTDCVYTTSGMKQFSTNADAQTIPIRDTNGDIIVKLTPSADNNPASKKYVDDLTAGLSSVNKVKVVATQPTSPTLGIMYYIGTAAPYQIKLYAEDESGTPTWFDLGTTAIDLSQYILKSDIVDNLTTDDATKVLSAKQGKVLNDNKVDTGNVTSGKLWKGTKAQYEAITTKDASTIYMITDDASASSSVFDMIYPLGSVYLSMDVNGALPLSFIGTWKKVSSGKYILTTTGGSIQPASTGGSSSITLTSDNLAPHSHTLSTTVANNGSHSHTKGSMRIAGYGGDKMGIMEYSTTGCISNTNKKYTDLMSNGSGIHLLCPHWDINIDTDLGGWTGSTSSDGSHNHTVTGTAVEKTTAATPVTIEPPYIAVTMWQRIA